MNVKTWRMYPTCLFGFVLGRVRYEALGGQDFYENSYWGVLINEKPRIINGMKYAITHLQKQSRFGFLIIWPFCVYAWIQLRIQKQGIKPGEDVETWLPGTELGIYPRVGARWQAEDGTYEVPSVYPPWNLHMD